MAGKIKLFQTVKAFQEEGKIKLSSSELAQIDAETKALLRASRGKRAAKAPEGFDALLAQLEGKSPDEAYDAVVGFLKDKGELGGKPELDKPDFGGMDDGPEMEMGMGKGPGEGLGKGLGLGLGKGDGPGKPKFEDDDEGDDFGGFAEKKEKPEKPEKDEDDKPEKKDEDKEEKKPEKKDDDKDEKKEKKDDDKKEDKGDKDDLDGKKKDLLDKAAQMSNMEMKRDKLKLRQKKDRVEETDENTMAEMGIEDTDNSPLVSARMKQARVIITKQGNITAHNLDLGKPVFHAVVPNHIKANVNELKKFANKVYGWIIYEGWNKAAQKCGAFVLNGGVDEDIDTNFKEEIEGDTKGITEEAETNAQQKVDSPEGDVLKENDMNTKEKVDTVTAARAAIRARVQKRLAQRRRATDILSDSLGDNIDGEDNQNKPSGDTQGDATNDMEIKPSKENSDMLSDGDVDYKEAENHYRRLYATKAKKATEEAVSNWVAKFNRCLKIASARMQLNHEANPFKIAAVDVLTAEDVQFTDGDFYNPMETKVAVELVELMSNEGHDGFVSHLLKSASDLLEKSDEYLEDAESDLGNLSPNPVTVEEKPSTVNARSNSRRNALRRGNVELTGASTPSVVNKLTNNSVRDALAGGTSVGRRIARINS